jgi:hypothetical protein
MLTVDGKTCICEMTMQGNLVMDAKDGTLITIKDAADFLRRVSIPYYGKRAHGVAEFYKDEPESKGE